MISSSHFFQFYPIRAHLSCSETDQQFTHLNETVDVTHAPPAGDPLPTAAAAAAVAAAARQHPASGRRLQGAGEGWTGGHNKDFGHVCKADRKFGELERDRGESFFITGQ